MWEDKLTNEGVGNICSGGGAVFYEADDGGNDMTLTPQEFIRRFKITAAIMA